MRNIIQNFRKNTQGSHYIVADLNTEHNVQLTYIENKLGYGS